MIYNKLVRDRIPEIIKENGKHPVYRKIQGKELAKAAKEKLREEVEEFLASDMDIGEMADIFEVIGLLMDINNWTYDQIGQAQLDKEKARGAFFNGIYLEYVEENPVDNMERLKEFEALEDNWNDYGAKPLCREHIETARTFLKNLPDVFEVFPLADGGIQIEYETGNHYIEMDIEDTITVYSEPEGFEYKFQKSEQEKALDLVRSLLENAKEEV